MNPKPLLACFLIFLSSCSSFRVVLTDSVLAKNRESLSRLSIDMPKSEVLVIMGTQTIEAYNSNGTSLIINNPYRTEVMKNAKGENLEVLFYYTDEKKSTHITDSELTPIVLKNGKVEGWGRSYLADVVHTYRERLY